MKWTMTLSLILCLSLTGWCAGEPPSLRPKNPIPVLPDIEALDLSFLETCRRYSDFLKREVASDEKWLQELKKLSAPELIRRVPELKDWFPKEIGRVQEGLEEHRQELQKWEKFVRELEKLEQQRKLNPSSRTEEEGLALLDRFIEELLPPTAPPPREVKKQVPLQGSKP